MSKGLTVMKEGYGREGGWKGNDLDEEGVCDGEGSKSRTGRFLSVAFFGSSLLYFSGLRGLLRGLLSTKTTRQ